MRQRAFVGPDADQKYERSGKWLLATVFRDDNARAWCKSNNVAITRAANEGIDGQGAFLVPTELARVIMDIREMYGAFRRRAFVYPMASDSTQVPRRTGGVTATFIAENTAGTLAQTVIDSVNVTAKKIGALITYSSELEEDSIVSLVDFVANELGWAFAAKEDDCAFNGDGTSAYGGMRGINKIVLDGNHGIAKVAAQSGHNTFLTLDPTDLGSLISGIRASAVANAAWFISQTAFAQTFCRLASADGGGYLYQAPVNGIMTPHYLGFPVILSQKMPQASTSLSGSVMMAFGDMYHGAVLGQRRGITIARSDQRYLEDDQIAIFGTERFDAIIHDVGDNSNAGSIAALVGG